VRKRKIPKRLRTQMNKSSTQTCPICKRPERLVEHHIHGRGIPNPNHESNLANICSNCHERVHGGRIIIESWIMTTSGLELIWHKEDDESFTGNDAKPHIV